MRLIPVMYYGFTAMDRRFSSPMLPWIVSEIRKRGHYEKLSAAVEDGNLQIYNIDFEVQLSHRVANMSRFSQADIDPCTFLYLLRDDNEQLLYCYLYKAYQISDVTDLYQQMKDQTAVIPITHNPPTRSLSSAAMLTSLCVDISPSSSNFFEVLYIGKIKVWQKNVPDTFIDDALQKFKLHDLERARKKLGRLKSEMNLHRPTDIANASSDNSRESSPPVPTKKLTRSYSLLSNLSIKSTDIDRKMPEAVECIAEIADDPHADTIAEHQSAEQNENATEHKDTDKKYNDTSTDDSTDDNREQSPTGNGACVRTVEYETKLVDATDHNRTMVLQIDRTDLRLISPDRKVVLLSKQHVDVFTCIQGIQKPDHFGFICRETTNVTTFTGYVFRCQSASVATETVSAITQAYSNADCHSSTSGGSGGVKHSTSRRQSSASSGGIGNGAGGGGGGPVITSCEHCPMVWYHKLCTEVEQLNDRKTQEAILSRIYLLEEQEKNTILTKFRGAETDSLREQNEFLMMLLRAHCEMKQARHIHDTTENRTEFLNQYLGGGNTIFMKAKRSLTNSFDHLLKRRPSKDDFGPVLKEMNLPLNRDSTLNQNNSKTDSENESWRSKSSTMGSQDSLNSKDTLSIKDNNVVPSISPDKQAKSPMLDIFMKVGTNPKVNPCDDSDNTSISSTNGTPPNDHQPPSHSTANSDGTSWRQNIFKRVITSGKNAPSASNVGSVGYGSTKKSKEELRVLWKKAIKQAVLLVRMEKENARIRAQQESSAVKRIKLEYDELKSAHQVVPPAWWETFLCGENYDRKELLKASRNGIPRGKRGEIWKQLVEEDDAKLPPIDVNKFPNYHVPYETLLKQLTSHQHAILIDLGRTFPNHSYFSSPLGPGQLALFNLLKAYSLLDPEVGYCQGLSFVTGVLLLHLDESDSFYLLRHLMFRRSLRRQYLPNMVGLQIQLYQLSRLVHDRLPMLHQHLDQHDVDPTLYAAPWLLTIFASQFPLGFVTRVFDLIFLEDPEVLFRVSLSLLEYHKKELLNCSSFEEIMDYMKLKLATFEREQLDAVMDQVYSLNISRPLLEYDIEYTVLQEEMLTIQPQVTELHRLQKITSTLTAQNKVLNTQLDLALTNVQRLEMTRTVHQNTINKLEMQNRNLEVSITALSTYIRNTIGEEKEPDIPADIKRIMSQVTYTERRRSGSGNFMNLFGKKPAVNSDSTNQRASPHRVMIKSLSTGRIIIPDGIKQNDLKKSVTHEVLDENTAKQSFFSRAHQDILKTNDPGVPPRKNRARYDFVPCEVIEDVSPTDSVDSGVITPDSHPLCGADVTFNYQGTKELRKVKCLRSMVRNSSPDLLNPN